MRDRLACCAVLGMLIRHQVLWRGRRCDGLEVVLGDAIHGVRHAANVTRRQRDVDVRVVVHLVGVARHRVDEPDRRGEVRGFARTTDPARVPAQPGRSLADAVM